MNREVYYETITSQFHLGDELPGALLEDSRVEVDLPRSAAGGHERHVVEWSEEYPSIQSIQVSVSIELRIP